MKKKNAFVEKCKLVPWYGWVFGVGIILFQGLFHAFGTLFGMYVGHKYFCWEPKIYLDKFIPLVPYFFVEIYILWFVFVPIGGIVAGRRDKKSWINLMLAWMISVLIGFIIYLLLPSYIDRRNVWGVEGGDLVSLVQGKKGLSWWIMSIMVNFSDESWCAFPSFHCLCIIFCYLGVARQKNIHISWRISQLLIAILVCLSTVFVKQHYIIDFLMSLALCLITYMIVCSFDVGAAILKKCPNFLIVKKWNYTHEKIVPLSKENKGPTKIEKK